MSPPPLAHGLLRGLLPLHVFSLLQAAPRHGLEIARAIEDRTGGHWKPSPGTLYPTLQRLEREGLIQGSWKRSQAAPRRVYRLTDAGRLARLSLRRRLLEELALTRALIDDEMGRLEAESGPGQRRLFGAKDEPAPPPDAP